MVEKVRVYKRHSFEGHQQSVYALARGLEPESLLSAGGDGFVARWDLQTGAATGAVLQTTAAVYALASERRLGLLAAGQMDGQLQLAEPSTRTLRWGHRAHMGPVYALHFTAELLLSAGADGWLRAWRLDTGALQAARQLGPTALRALTAAPEAPLLAVGASEGQLSVVTLPELKLVYQSQAHPHTIFALHWQGNQLYSAGREGHLRAWDMQLPTEPRLMQALIGHNMSIHALAATPGGRYLATGSMDKSLRIWQADSLTLLKVIDHARHQGHTNSVNSLLWLPGLLLSASDDRSICSWELDFYAAPVTDT